MQTIVNNTNIIWHICCVLIGFVIALLTYFKHKSNSNITKSLFYFLFFTRFLFTALICYLLLNIFFKSTTNKTQQPVIIVAVDKSESIISSKDSLILKNTLIKNIENLKSNLSQQFEVKLIEFGDKSTSVNILDNNFNLKKTNIDELFLKIENDYANLSIGALVLFSDGIYNEGSNPIYQTKKIDYPIYSVAVGDTTEFLDASIQKINHNSIAYLGNIFPIDVHIISKKLLGKELQVTLSKDGKSISSKKININQNNLFSSISFTAEALKPGIQKYDVLITVFDEEKNKLNNYSHFLIDVIDNKEKILIVANSPHPDIAAIKSVLDELGTFEINYTLINEIKTSLKEYSSIILHGGNEATNALVVKESIKNSIPVFYILTSEKVSYARTNEVTPVIDKNFNSFVISSELKSFIDAFPAVNSPFGNYNENTGDAVLFKQKIGSVETNNPLLFFKEINGLKSGYFYGDGLWRWKLREFAENQNNNLFNELILKSVQYLTVKNDKSFFRVKAPKIINENESIEFGAEVYNKSYELVNTEDVLLSVTNNQNKKYQFTFNKLGNAYQLNIGELPIGEYSYKAQTKLGAESFIKEGSFIIKPLVTEKINTVANHQLLYQLALTTNGKFLNFSQINEISNLIKTNQTIKPITYSENNTNQLINFKWIIVVIVSLMALEWYLRKMYLTI
jgi:hypothetical protein